MTSVPYAGGDLAAAFRNYPDVIKADDIASVLRMNKKTVYAYASRGDLPSFKLQSNRLFLKSEVIRWVIRQNPRFRPGNGPTPAN